MSRAKPAPGTFIPLIRLVTFMYNNFMEWDTVNCLVILNDMYVNYLGVYSGLFAKAVRAMASTGGWFPGRWQAPPALLDMFRVS